MAMILYAFGYRWRFQDGEIIATVKKNRILTEFSFLVKREKQSFVE